MLRNLSELLNNCCSLNITNSLLIKEYQKQFVKFKLLWMERISLILYQWCSLWILLNEILFENHQTALNNFFDAFLSIGNLKVRNSKKKKNWKFRILNQAVAKCGLFCCCWNYEKQTHKTQNDNFYSENDV